jgi:predicted RNase H-like nuclease (RuvC/YqgF family)
MSDWLSSQPPSMLRGEALVNEIDAIFDAYVQLVGGSTPLIQRISKEDLAARESLSLTSLNNKIQAQDVAIDDLKRSIGDLETTRATLGAELEALRSKCQELSSTISSTYV